MSSEHWKSKRQPVVPQKRRERPTAQAAVDKEPLPITTATSKLNELRLTLVYFHHGGHGKFSHSLNEQGWFHYDAVFAELGERRWVVEVHKDEIELIRAGQWPNGKKKGMPPEAVQVIAINRGANANLRVRGLRASEALQQIAEAEVPDGGKI